jgi:hypothetical protein
LKPVTTEGGAVLDDLEPAKPQKPLRLLVLDDLELMEVADRCLVKQSTTPSTSIPAEIAAFLADPIFCFAAGQLAVGLVLLTMVTSEKKLVPFCTLRGERGGGAPAPELLRTDGAFPHRSPSDRPVGPPCTAVRSIPVISCWIKISCLLFF